jgi:hypothetical protein
MMKAQYQIWCKQGGLSMIQEHYAPFGAAAGAWDPGVLGPVREINEQVVDSLCEATVATPKPCTGLLDVVRREFLQASVEARQRLAAAPFLLLDAGFADSASWVRPSGVQEVSAKSGASMPVLDLPIGIVHRTLLLGWHLARTNRLAARVALGMTPTCAELIGSLRLRDLETLAERDRGCVRLRWERRTELWRPLLLAAASGQWPLLESLQMRGLQLLAAEELR